MCNQLTNNMKRTLTSILVILVIHISCTNPIKQEQDLSRAFFSLLDSSNYTSIDFRELPIEDWDIMVVLTPYTNPRILKDNFRVRIPREIKRIGLQYSETISLILFIKDNSIVSYFTYPTTLDFSKINQLTGHKFNEAKFMIENTERKTIAGDQIYILK